MSGGGRGVSRGRESRPELPLDDGGPWGGLDGAVGLGPRAQLIGASTTRPTEQLQTVESRGGGRSVRLDVNAPLSRERAFLASF